MRILVSQTFLHVRRSWNHQGASTSRFFLVSWEINGSFFGLPIAPRTVSRFSDRFRIVNQNRSSRAARLTTRVERRGPGEKRSASWKSVPVTRQRFRPHKTCNGFCAVHGVYFGINFQVPKAPVRLASAHPLPPLARSLATGNHRNARPWKKRDAKEPAKEGGNGDGCIKDDTAQTESHPPGGIFYATPGRQLRWNKSIANKAIINLVKRDTWNLRERLLK